MIRSSLLIATLFAIAPTTGAAGQVRLPVQPPVRQLNPPPRAQDDTQTVPAAYRPPPGMCRIWLDNVAPAQQPAPTDCASAVRNRPNNGRVLFGDDYVDRRKGRDKDKDKRPERSEIGDLANPAASIPRGPFGRPPGPSADESLLTYATYEAEQPPRTPRDSVRRRVRTDSTLNEKRRAARDRRTDARDARDARDDDDDIDDDVRDDRRGDGATRGGYYPPYAPPARANGTCLDRDRDGYCDDVRGGSNYCVDRDGDGRCDDYGDLASAPYASSMPPMSAAVDVKRGAGSALALRWLGTAEVMVRTSDTRRTGIPYRAMWFDASTNRLLQVWTDRDGDGTADRIEIYRNGRISKTIGR